MSAHLQVDVLQGDDLVGAHTEFFVKVLDLDVCHCLSLFSHGASDHGLSL